MRISEDFPRVAGEGHEPPCEIVERFTPWTGNLDDPVYRRLQRGSRHGGRDVLAGDRLHQGRRHPYDPAIFGVLDHARQKLEELRGTHNGVRNPGIDDQLLLRDLASKIAARLELLRADDSQSDMAAHTGFRLSCKEVAAGGLEEMANRLVVKRRRVGKINNNLGTDQRR